MVALKPLIVKSYEAAIDRISKNLVKRSFAPRFARAGVPAPSVQLVP